jgi:hypothetical protein
MRYFCLAYLRQPNGQFNESTAIVKNLKNRDYQSYGIILDFKNREIIKCHISNTVVQKDWNNIVNYYRKFYRDVFQQLELNNQTTTGNAGSGEKH